MCGICGIFRPSGIAEQEQHIIQAMTQLLRHRGPDHQATYSDGRIALGHDRLSVLDLTAAAHQPMHSSDGRFILVYNGELYNYRELKKELEGVGINFQTSSDTEVLLQLFIAHGKACLSQINGMFALAVWDKKEQKLFLARDRFGQKPLFYAKQDNLFLFASEVMALFAHPDLQRRPCLNAIYHYLTVQSVPAPLSAFEHVHKLPPAHCLEITADGGMELTRYWTPPNRVYSRSVQEAEEELDCLLQRAVARHLLSDVPVGLFLSGGVDSSIIAAIACRQCMGIQSFSMGFAESDHDERRFALEASHLCGTVHSSSCVTADVMENLPEMVWHYGEPFGDSSALPTWLLCALSKQRVTVALSGDGGDDLFGGYERYLNPFLYAAEAPSEIMQQHAELLHELQLENVDATGLTPALSKYYFHWARFCGQHKRRLCHPALRNAAHPPLSLQFLLEYRKQHQDLPLLDAIQRFEWEYYLASTLMPKIDIASMAFSLEVRAPLLDCELADFAASLPASMKVRALGNANAGSFGKGYEAKWLLKKVACRYFPYDFVYRRKMGFGVPLASWLRGPLKEFMHDVLSPTSSVFEWVDQKEIQLMMDEHERGIKNHEYRLWVVLMLAMWKKVCFSSTDF